MIYVRRCFQKIVYATICHYLLLLQASPSFAAVEHPFKFLCYWFRPYVIDLESTNGTFVNNNKIEARRYVEVIEQVSFLVIIK